MQVLTTNYHLPIAPSQMGKQRLLSNGLNKPLLTLMEKLAASKLHAITLTGIREQTRAVLQQNYSYITLPAS